MSILSTISFIVGGLFIALCVFVPLAFLFWIYKLNKIKKIMIKHFEEIARKVAPQILNNEPEEIIIDTEDVID